MKPSVLQWMRAVSCMDGYSVSGKSKRFGIGITTMFQPWSWLLFGLGGLLVSLNATRTLSIGKLLPDSILFLASCCTIEAMV